MAMPQPREFHELVNTVYEGLIDKGETDVNYYVIEYNIAQLMLTDPDQYEEMAGDDDPADWYLVHELKVGSL